MAIKAHELQPKQSSFSINGTVYELYPFSLSKRIWAQLHFSTDKEEANGLKVLSEKLADFKNFDTLAEVIHYLLKDKDDFKNPYELLQYAEKNGGLKTYHKMYKALCECLGLSEPQMEDVENALEVKKSLAIVR